MYIKDRVEANSLIGSRHGERRRHRQAGEQGGAEEEGRGVEQINDSRERGNYPDGEFHEQWEVFTTLFASIIRAYSMECGLGDMDTVIYLQSVHA